MPLQDELKKLKKKRNKDVLKKIAIWCTFVVIGIILICFGETNVFHTNSGLLVGLGATTIGFSGAITCVFIRGQLDTYMIDKNRCIAENSSLNSISDRDWASTVQLLSKQDMSNTERNIVDGFLRDIENCPVETPIQPAICLNVTQAFAGGGIGYINQNAVTTRIPLPPLGVITSEDKSTANVLRAFAVKCQQMTPETVKEFELFENNRLKELLDQEDHLPPELNELICSYAFPFPAPISEEDTTRALVAHRQRKG
jgi:hypothetical protein